MKKNDSFQNKKTEILEYNRKIFREFKKSLKDTIFDETLTLYILRPIAFVFVKILYPTSVTPNQVSFAAIILGFISAFFFALGDVSFAGIPHINFIIGGILYFFILVLDCVDGMIARLKKNGTLTGRIIDGFADYTVGISVYIGLGIGFDKMGGLGFPISHWWLLIIAAASHIFHSVIVDYYRVEFMSHGLGKSGSAWEDKNKFKAELAKIKHEKGHIIDKFLITLYIGYSHLQLFQLTKKESFEQKSYFDANQFLIKLWFWIGPTAHIFALIFAVIVFRIEYFFIYTIGIANIYMLALWIIQVKIKQKLRA
ncbi:MAG: CDP-alcohol phosphatidyltransferase family protein [Candidatus Cloacimonetes bacterium]|jgi:phosphatidylglycerophosphate synthase|nr:CDP-alcohol phosphatidyltransferase family protein [Candidatus Cloacimonadota bacterium]MBT6993535.1 CDP-alcohol phosphatidyltransferase family protein [Candidatus Cloacimonadota bacterium]MBT7469447.1 CDP-alcohol phosphatidyltransferase family protein [Candidatus Cloacimonadota bacterium]